MKATLFNDYTFAKKDEKTNEIIRTADGKPILVHMWEFAVTGTATELLQFKKAQGQYYKEVKDQQGNLVPIWATPQTPKALDFELSIDVLEDGRMFVKPKTTYLNALQSMASESPEIASALQGEIVALKLKGGLFTSRKQETQDTGAQVTNAQNTDAEIMETPADLGS
jgi:hypothetical protein